ncbi:cofactor-independent phosphoglycerate mutase [Candidatus Poribacteria bacterium]|nr:cofactor-independent phosphoglycerate mutase [Candidatus Poribacteria bacterium]MBT5533548.1 cofactor-independent phosphoglycerate mutase [Candidatus Poribacteria bacterium]MBT5714100.1 cofactor-independent phosphoglycerate mutase [Candidatus Poribacteria bacterium]MBT7099143.1 cofactor-independent phosphoglycerate mutase [Candidatus Poribacteria bacterium]MBT7805858.1 cofactor-independent phosphoglycerate mutase [Candidatus Poribacteria bacterium]
MKAARDTKFIVILVDGAADFPLDELGGRTPLAAADTPNMDAVARGGVVGSLDPIPEGQSAGSDVGNLSVLGYDPDVYLTGRAPLEAAAMDIALGPADVAFRCNLVTLDDGVMQDYSAGHISTEEAAELIESVEEALGTANLRYHAGVQYRHILVAGEQYAELGATPPHDIIGHDYAPYLPTGEGSEDVREWMVASRAVLAEHPVNRKRVAAGKAPGNSTWLWGQGKAPTLPTYAAKYGVNGNAISAVDLVRGIARYAGLSVLHVDGITGFLDTNYVGKAEVGLSSLDDADFVYIHVEAPDEAAHLGDAAAKIEAIEAIDREIVARALAYAGGNAATRIAVLPDHITAIRTRTHAPGAVPFAACGVGIKGDGSTSYCEAVAAQGSLGFPSGHLWMDWFLGPTG